MTIGRRLLSADEKMLTVIKSRLWKRRPPLGDRGRGPLHQRSVVFQGTEFFGGEADEFAQDVLGVFPQQRRRGV